MLRILYDDLDQKVKNIHDEMDLHHSYKKKRVRSLNFQTLSHRTYSYLCLTFVNLMENSCLE